jgi:hypothetical protein
VQTWAVRRTESDFTEPIAVRRAAWSILGAGNRLDPPVYRLAGILSPRLRRVRIKAASFLKNPINSMMLLCNVPFRLLSLDCYYSNRRGRPSHSYHCYIMSNLRLALTADVSNVPEQASSLRHGKGAIRVAPSMVRKYSVPPLPR